MTQIATLSEFLDASGVIWRTHDLSRRVTELPASLLREVEQGLRPFPTPRQQKAWLAITFWHPTTAAAQPFIWFVALPLDERGIFQHAALQHFMSIIVDALGAQPTAELTESQQQRLQQNPYIFQPDEGRRAAFHAQISAALGQAPSIHFEHAEAYFTGRSDINWQQLGIQGIHDMAVRSLQQPVVQQYISQHYLGFPEPLQEALCLALEQVILPSPLQQNLLALRTQVASPAVRLRLIRCVSGRANEPALQQWLRQLLTASRNGTDQQELLLVIAARCWSVLQDNTLLELFLTKVAQSNLTLFITLYKELVAIAELRPHCLSLLYQQNLNPSLQHAVLALKQSVRESTHV